MACSRHAWLCGALALAALLLSWHSGPVHAAPTATESTCSFSPGRGGPGTLVHVYVRQWFGATSLEFGFAVPRTSGAHAAAIHDPESLAPLDPPLALVPLTIGSGDATFVMPARLSTGAPIPQHDLYLMCRSNGQVAGDAIGEARPFSFIPAALPTAGRAGSHPALLLLLLSVLLILGGARIAALAAKPRLRLKPRLLE